jgi:LacI family transcriptional regulator
MARPKLQDVADLAKVSIATVHRVVHNQANVTPEKRRRVLDIYQRVYRQQPDTAANLIGLILPEGANPYFSRLGFQFEHVLEQEGFHLLVSSSDERPDRELDLVQRFRSLGVKGLIFVPSGPSGQQCDALLSLIADGDTPVIIFDRRFGPGTFDYVAVDSRIGTICAVDYLVTHQHTRIAYLRGLEGTESARERFDSFREALARNRLEPKPEWIFEGDYTWGAGRSCAERLIAMSAGDRPTAILAANDLMAIGLMQRLQESGWALPRQLSVIGFDDIELAQYTFPALTTISQPVHKLVRAAVRLLLNKIRGGGRRNGHSGAETIVIEPMLVPRASVTGPFDPSAPLQVVKPV